jgi:hypothetical protein
MGLLKIPSAPRKYLYEAPELVPVPSGRTAVELEGIARSRISRAGMRIVVSETRDNAVTWPNGEVELPRNWNSRSDADQAILLWHESAHAYQRKSMGAFTYRFRYALAQGWWFAMEVEAEQQEMLAMHRLGFTYSIKLNEDRLCDGKTYKALSRFYNEKHLREMFRDVMTKRKRLIESTP